METRNNNKNIEKKERVAQPENAYILSLPAQVLLNIISEYLTKEDQMHLAKTCYSLYTIFKPNLDKIAFKQLLQAVIDDETNMVKKILDNNPTLLLQDPKNILSTKEIKEGIVSQLTWQRFFGRPFEISTFRGQFEMTKLLLSYFNGLANGKTEALAQWKVPEINKEEKDLAYANKMKTLIEMISKETFPNGTEKDRLIDRINKETKAVLAAFRKELLPDRVITLENYPDIAQLLIAGYKAYKDHFNLFQNLEQRNLYCIAILGFIQSVLNPELAKMYCENLYGVVWNNTKISERAAKFKLDDDTSFYRSDSDVLSGLGYDCLIAINGGVRLVSGAGVPEGERAVKKVSQATKSNLQDLKRNLSQGVYPNQSQSIPEFRRESAKKII